MDHILLKGSQKLKTINIDLLYPGVEISIDFLHVHCYRPSESYNLHAHPNFELHYIAGGEGEVGFIDTKKIDTNDIFQIPALVKSKSTPDLNEYRLKHMREIEVIKNTRVFKLQKGDAFMNPPGQFCWHKSSEDDPIVEYGMRFSFSIKKTETPVNKYFIKEYKIIHQLLSQNIIQVTHNNTEIKSVFETIFKEAFYMRPGFVSKIKNELLNLIIVYSRLSWDMRNQEYYIPEVNTKKKRLEMIDSFIHSNLRNNVKIKQLAKYVFMSERNLSRFIKEHKGVSVHQYILQLRINKAIALYTKTGDTLNDVAYITGFSSPFHLSKAIKKYTGKNPSEL